MDRRADRGGNDGTFKVEFSDDGAARLQERLAEKLKEFMGDYTDETLVGYIVVLLRNGRSKDQASNLLSAFLGDDTAAFVSWLWDHLSANMHLYVLSEEPLPDETTKSNKDYERKKSTKVTSSLQNREWNRSVLKESERFPLGRIVSDISPTEDGSRYRLTIGRRSHSPKPQVSRKRSRDDEDCPGKRSFGLHPVIDAPRRLLQFAVRDAVKAVQQSNSTTEPTFKRLCSVVSTSATDSLQEKEPERTRSGSIVPGALRTALKAVSEAAADASRVMASSSVFDRLNHVRTKPILQLSDTRPPELEDLGYQHLIEVTSPDYVGDHQRSKYSMESPGNLVILDKETEMADFASDNDVCDDVDIITRHGYDAIHSIPSSIKDNKSVMVEYSIEQEPYQAISKRRVMSQDPPARSAGMTLSKIVNISVNVNTWNPPNCIMPRDIYVAVNRAAVAKSDAGAGKPNTGILKENVDSVAQKDMEHVNVQKASQNTASSIGPYKTSRPQEDFESRTLFVSNVHFAATKDALSRHFNKFGNVLKVVIVTDVTTGQPTGSAYVEFVKKESSDLALSLNGISFMSRILKVVRSSSHEASPILGWPGIAWATSYSSSLGRIPFLPRGVIPGSFRTRLPVKPGARSLQWKREPSTSSSS